MFVLSRRAASFQSVLGTALLAGFALTGVAQAQTVTVNSMAATGTYLLNGAVSDALSDTDPPGNGSGRVDVLSFPFAAGSGAGLHSYGGASGIFGSRSSGFGIYDVLGSYVINLSIRNDQATAQNVTFDFYVTPGVLEVTDLPYDPGQFAEAGLGFSILASNGKSFGSTAALRSDSTGLTYNTTGDNLYGGSGANRSVVGGLRSLNLGLLAAGESVDLSYTLSSYAKGNAVLGRTVVIPATQVVIPGYWSTCTNVEAAAAVTDAAAAAVVAEVVCDGQPFFVPEQVVDIPERTIVEGDVAGSQASSGDPFSFNFQAPGQTLALPPSQNNQSFSVTVADPAGGGASQPTNNVPEPGALSLVMLALAGAGVTTRARRS